MDDIKKCSKCETNTLKTNFFENKTKKDGINFFASLYDTLNFWI